MSYRNEFIGNEDQLMTVTEAKLCQGRQEGVKEIRIDNGGDLSVTILPDRAMDIYQIRYKGKNLNYIGPNGIVGPEYYNDRGIEWLRSFFVGFLTTLGLQHMGSDMVVNGEPRGLHGKESSCPAEDVHITRGIENGKPTVTVEGTMREARLFGENLRLHRSLKFFYEDNKMELTDTVENMGFGTQQYYLGYHINYGYPLLDEGTEVKIRNGGAAPKARTEYSASFPESYKYVTAPDYPYPERCYFHEMEADEDGKTGYSIFNEKLNIGVKLSYDKDVLPNFCQWQMFGKGEYVCGLEPICCDMDAPHIGEEGCPAPVLNPGETRTYKLCFEFIDKL